MSKLALGYYRVSSDEQKGNYSIPQQKRSCKEYADKNGYRIVKNYTDDGFSATADNRPAFLQMIDDCESGKTKIQAIIVYHTDRFARNEFDHSYYKNRLQKAGIELIAVMQLMIDNSPEGHLIDTMMSGINAYYSRDLSRKTKRGMLGRWNAGWWPGWAPPGYVNLDKEGKLSKKYYTFESQRYFNSLNRRLDPIEIDPLLGPLVQEAFQLYSTGNFSFIALAKHLAKKGFINRRGKPISSQVLQTTITNPFYYKWMKWGGMEKQGNHKALVTKELFDLCGCIAAQHRQFLTRSRKHTWLLIGLAFCHTHTCQRRVYEGETKYISDYRRLTAEYHYGLNSKTRDRISYYHCTAIGGCKSSYIETIDLEKLVENQIKKMQFSEEFIELIKSKIRKILDKSKIDIQSQIKGFENRKTGLKHKQSKLLDLLIEGEIPKDALKEKQQELENQIKDIEFQIQELESKAKLDYQLIEEVLSLTHNIYQTYVEAPDFLKRHYLKLFFERIYVKDKKIVKIVENPVFSVLKKQHQVIITQHLLPR